MMRPPIPDPFFAANNRRNDAASITVLRSDEPVSVNTATFSASDGTQRTSMQTTTSGGFVSQTTTSSSSSSSSSSFNNNKNPNQQQQQQQPNDRVALGVATPTADVVFNVGPTLGEVGIRATGASTAASQGMSMNAYTVVDAGALAVSDGAVVEASANANGANASSPPAPRPVKVTVTSPAVNFTFAFAEGTTNAKKGEGEGGATFVACIRLPASRNLSKVAIVAPAATVAMSFEPNQQQPTSTSVSRTGPSAPTEGAFITHTADVSVQVGGTVVEARRLFGLRYPAAWAADLTDEALQTAAPRCVRRTCNGNGADASSGGVACPADFVVPT